MDSSVMVVVGAGAVIGFAMLFLIGMLHTRASRHPNLPMMILRLLVAAALIPAAFFALSYLALKPLGLLPLGHLSPFYGIGFMIGAVAARLAGASNHKRRRAA